MEKEQLKARFFGMHIGCLFTHPDFEEPQKLMGVAESPPGTFNYDRIGSCFYKDGWVDIERCQLILKPLSSITKEDAIEVSEIKIGDIPEMYKISVGKFGIGRISHKWDDLNAFDFLRSKGYCLPYLGLNPVKENWAIIEENK